MEKKIFRDCEIKSFDDEKLIIEHFISTEHEDDIGDVVLADGMITRGRPVVLLQHGADLRYGLEPIAKPLSLRIGINKNGNKGIIAQTQFYDGSHLTPADNTGRRLYEKNKQGYFTSWSIGFDIIDYENRGKGRLIKKWVLLEYSQVAIGMNAEAQTITEDKDLFDLCLKTKYVIKENSEEKPYVNEHACRLQDPSQYKNFARIKRKHNEKEYSIIIGEKDGEWEEQAYRYNIDIWKKEEAEEHCKNHNGKFEPAEPKDLTNEKDKQSEKKNIDNSDTAIDKIPELNVDVLNLSDVVNKSINKIFKKEK